MYVIQYIRFVPSLHTHTYSLDISKPVRLLKWVAAAASHTLSLIRCAYPPHACVRLRSAVQPQLNIAGQ